MLSQGISSRHAGSIIIALAIVQCIIQMSLLTRGTEYAAISLLIDDTYYYLQTAWNAKMLGFVTFDGLHTTNGVQLLWFVIIYCLALLAGSKTVLIFSVLATGFLLNALCFLAILRIGQTLEQPALALLMASLWSLQSLPFRIYSMGMENSLHALVFWCALWQCAEFLTRIQSKTKLNFFGLTVVLILNAWTRLDSALLSAILFTFCVATLASNYRHSIRLFFHEHAKAITGSSFLAGIGLAVQLSAFQIMGNSFLPVSALVKTSLAGRGENIEALEKLNRVFTLGMPSILQGRAPDLILVSLGIASVLLVILARVQLRDPSSKLRAFYNLWSCLLLGEVIYYLYVAFSKVEYSAYFIWYRSPSFIFWIATGSLLVLFAVAALRWDRRQPILARWAPVALSLLFFVTAVYMFVRSIDFASKLYSVRYGAALWIAENYPSDTVFASWNAGQLSFFSDRTVINLDGVINSVDYYKSVLIGSTPLTDYLTENNVDYIVDYDTYGAIPDFPVEQAFPINDGSGRSIRIWRVSPQVSLDP